MKGDLILKVNLINNDKYEKIGFDLVYNKKMDPLSLAIEDNLIIDHPDGNLSIKIPENVSTLKPLRIHGKGYKTPQGNGNFYIKIIIEKNENISSDIKEEIKKILKQPHN